MIYIVPVEEFMILSNSGKKIEADPELYSIFRDQFFFNRFIKTLPKKVRNSDLRLDDTKKYTWYNEVNDVYKLIDKFNRKRKKIINYQGIFYTYKFKEFNWCAIELIKFDSEQECMQFFGKDNKLWKALHVLLPFTKGVQNV
jgi:hypothetical protein